MSDKNEIYVTKTDLLASPHDEIPTKLGKKTFITKTNVTVNNFTRCLEY